MKATLVQKKYVLGDKEANLAIMDNETRAASGELVIFPEMFLTGYGIRDQMFTLAEDPETGPSVERIKALAAETGKTIVFGMPVADQLYKGNVFNGAVIVEPNGNVHVYRKMFLPNFGPFEEKLFFSLGSTSGLFDTALGRIGVIICYDIFFPELSRTLAVGGADMIICLSASPTVSKEKFELLAKARAVENTVFFLYSNVVGPDRDLVFWGGAEVVGPKGDVMAKAAIHEEDIIDVELEPEELAHSRRTRPALRDIRDVAFHNLMDVVLDRE